MRTEYPVCGETLPESAAWIPAHRAEVATCERGAIAQANSEFRTALDQSRKRRLQAAHFRRCLDVIDACLSRLEDLHLADLPIAKLGGRQAVLQALVTQTGEEPPAAVRTARNSYALHEALLDWEWEVLDALVPRRPELFPDSNKDRDKPRRMRRRRRKGLGSPQVLAACRCSRCQTVRAESASGIVQATRSVAAVPDA
jgi:hypothetical protein